MVAVLDSWSVSPGFETQPGCCVWFLGKPPCFHIFSLIQKMDKLSRMLDEMLGITL